MMEEQFITVVTNDVISLIKCSGCKLDMIYYKLCSKAKTAHLSEQGLYMIYD